MHFVLGLRRRGQLLQSLSILRQLEELDEADESN